MKHLRSKGVRTWLAAMAVLASVLHVALVAHHALMPLASGAENPASAAAALTPDQKIALAWTEEIRGQICRGVFVDDTGAPQRHGSLIQQCAVCAGVLGGVVNDAKTISAGPAVSPATTLKTGIGELRIARPAPSEFDARGPPSLV